MDKRSILAIAVTFLVLLLWQAVFIAPKQRAFQRKQAVELREKKRADSLAAVTRGTARAAGFSRPSRRAQSQPPKANS